jgi:DNA-binding SARP family transcriptional activator/predicted ATPase
MTPTLHIHLLGDFSLTYGDEPVDGVHAARLQSLLAYLVLHHDAPQQRQHLAFLFWPDSTEAQARNNLRQLLHELRHTLPDADQFLCADTRTLRWRPSAPFQIDVAEFEEALASADAANHVDRQVAALERAARLYHADLLPECYDDWIIPERQRLRERHRHAVKRLIGLLEARGDYAEAMRHARRLLRDDPIDEETWRDLMRLLALNHDRAGALRAYHTCADALRRELDVEPDQATRDMYERLLRLDALPPPAPERQPPRDAAPPLIGRRPEWEQLLAAWRHASAGEPSFALVTGEAGIGKSRLAEELLRWAGQQGASVATTRSYAAEGRLSLAPVTDWLRSEALRPHLARLDIVWLSEVARILPELSEEQPNLPPYEPIREYGQRQRFFEALARAVLIAPQPLLLLIDDVQWCDPETLEWLHYLLRCNPHARMLIVGAARAEDVLPHHPLRTLLLHLHSTMRVAELVLQSLEAAETAELAARVARRELDVDLTMRLYRETGGNPLFVVETMRAGFASAGRVDQRAEPGSGNRLALSTQPLELPPKVHAVIAARLAQLSEPARELAGLAAAVGRAFTLDLLFEAGYADEDSIVRALDELWQKGIVRDQGANGYDFTHDKLREVAYAEIGAPKRRLLHRRIAGALETIHTDVLDSIAGQIAAHYESARKAEQAIPYYQRAAMVAQRVYANEDAIALLSRGLALLERLPAGARRDAQELKIQLMLAPLYRMTKGWTSPEVERVLDRAMELCDRVGDDAQRAQVFYGLLSLYVVQARLEKVQLTSDELHRLYQRTHGITPPLEAEMMLAGSRLHLGRIGEASERFEHMLAADDPTEIQRIVEEQGWNYAVHGRVWHAHALWLLGYPDAAQRSALDGVRLAHERGQPFNQALAATYLAMLHQLCADEATAKAQAEAALAVTTEYKALYYRAWAAILNYYATACTQRRAPAIARLRESLAEFKASGARLRLPYYLGLLASACGRAGRAKDGLAAIDEAMAASRAHNERWWDAELHRLRGDLLLACGAGAREAEAAYLRAIEIARAQGARSLELRAATGLARLWQAQCRAQDARRALGEVYAWFTEGFETPDLQAARSLLAEL